MGELTTSSEEAKFKVAALYQFVYLPDLASLHASLVSQTKRYGILGGLIIAHEGLNGTISGKPLDMSSICTEETAPKSY